MIDELELYTALSESELALQARRHYMETDAEAGLRATRYRLFHSYAFPLNGDQWPQDLRARPGMIHFTGNIIGPAVMTESRIEALLPKTTLQPPTKDPETRARAERAEALQHEWLELSDWEVWLMDAAQCKSTYGKTILKPYWNKKDNRPDVSVIESPQNLRLGWGSSNYDVLDWALYEYAISPLEAMRRWPDLEITVKGRDKQKIDVIRHSDHADPLGQMGQTRGNLRTRLDHQPSDYENKQVTVWDYWCKDKDGNIVNAFFVEGVLAASPVNHNYYPDLPFIIIEHDHETGSPEGIGDVEPLIDIQDELNRAISHWAQLIADEIDPAYQADVESIPGGMIPKNGEVIAVGDGKQIRPIEKSVNQFPIKELIEALQQRFHFQSGLSEILFTLPPGAQTAGRALQIQIEASANRIDPRRKRLYRGLKELLIFWAEMAEKIDPKINVGFDEEGQPVQKGLKEILTGFRRWKFVAPEISPRDNSELITAVVNKLNNKLISLEDAQDELGVDSPLEMIRKIEAERANPKLYPADVQQYMAVIQMLQQYQLQEQAAAGGAPGPEEAAGNAQAAAQGSQPQGVQGDNGSGVPQPATAAGGPPSPGAPGPRLQNQSLIRAGQGPGGQVLQQVKVTTP